MAYIASNKNQNWLLPLSIKDMIPKDHICFLVEDFVHSLDFSDFDMIYDGAGHPAYHPKIIMKILIQGMLYKVRSTRKLATAARENFVFMYLAEKVNPDFRTINRFRKDNPEFVKDTFKKTVELASKHDLVDLSFISIDGSMLKANAGKKRYFDKKSLDKLDKAIDKMVDEDIAIGDLEEEMFGEKEEGLTGVERKDLKKIVREYRKSEDKKKIKNNIKKAKNDLEKYSLKKVSISDPEARMMQTKKRFPELSYNTQLSVDKNQVILANDICQDKHDANQFIPQIKNVKENIDLLKKTKVGLDSGFSSGDNIKFAEDENIDLYVPSRAQAQVFNGKEDTLNHDNYEYDWKNDEIIADGIRYPYHHSYIRKDSGKKILVYQIKGAKLRKQVPEFFRERLRMKEKMEKQKSKEVYDLRKITIEPVYGNLKQNLGFREFLLRSLESVKIEFNLVCIAHNLQKIWRLKQANAC
jgi:transposase|tara:strand:- start:53 stop:1459 length:1407 start_codon:yes stop_codon:yes gene_type:complete